MRIFRGVAAISIAKRVYDEARKPQNQARIKAAVERVRSSRKPRTR